MTFLPLVFEPLKRSNGEDIVLLDYDTRSLIAMYNDSDQEFGIGKYPEWFAQKMEHAVKNGVKIVAIHNHPNGLPPSADDCAAALNNGYYKGIAVGHNGSVYKYFPADELWTETKCEDFANIVALQVMNVRNIDDICETWQDLFRENGLRIRRVHK